MECRGIEHAAGNTIQSVSFSMYTPEQERKVSVKHITRWVTFDRLGRAQREGLHDPALGPIDMLERCETCAMSYDDCPGHYGHVELALPSFHPLLFNQLFKLLRICCFECSQLRMADDQKQFFAKVLYLIKEGKLLEASNLLSSDQVVVDDLITVNADGMDPGGDYSFPASSPAERTHKYQAKTCHQQELWEKTVAGVLGAMPTRCAACNAPAPSLKKDGFLRILKKPLAKRFRGETAKGKSTDSPRGSKGGKGAKGAAKKGVDMMSSDESEASSSEESSSSDDEEAVMSSAVAEKRAAVPEGGDLPVNISPFKALNLLKRVFKRDAIVLSLIFGVQTGQTIQCDASMFFLQTLLIPPNRFRPPVHLGDSQFEHPLNVHLKNIMQENEQILDLLNKVQGGADDESVLDSAILMKRWNLMQGHINVMIDSTKAERAPAAGVKGVRQDLERKEGLMRMNMMGKRVNFACRSVISPDPFMNTDQVGIPEVFAKKLSWPEPVNQYNARRLRAAVINGPNAWPGANYVVDERGNKIDLSKKDATFRTALAKRLEQRDVRGVNWKVGRHLIDGDFVLVNRQPTLHKVSLMAHKVRVNKGQRVIRFHYANCKSYNADFDGDEINVHFPQDQLGRAEAAVIVQNDHHYLVPTDGSPVRGLIQDHIVAAVQLCQLDRLLTRSEYMELVFLSLANLQVDLKLPRNEIITQPPFMVKPLRRWSGKQVISTLLHNLLHDVPALNMSGACKVKGAMYNQHKEEGTVILRGNDLMTGVLDKNHIGASAGGLVHALYEAHGPTKAGLCLTIFGRCFTQFMQFHRAFTCGVEELMVTDAGNAARRKMLNTANWRALDCSARFAEIDYGDDCSKVSGRELEKRSKAVTAALAHLVHEEKGRKLLDSRIQVALAPVTSGVIDSILPGGQQVAYPENNFEMMTATGAKGSKVNMSQICCLLGQQQLEGQRVPVMASGKTLPSFQPHETNARAGGFVEGRFLTGIRPQEYYFHCMAGREGLVDTAVKTSRSGYLQRCLMKHLESLTVAYDGTVRDCDGGVTQFLYGEDGVDPVKQLGLRWLSHLAENSQAVANTITQQVLDSMDRKSYQKHAKAVRKDAKSQGVSYQEARAQRKPLASLGSADRQMGYVSENFEDYIDEFLASNANSPDAPMMLRGDKAAGVFKELAYFKYARSLVAPGEAVGAVAAQSVGEPSTQMTLNTFHSAGQGNATAGIPRLRELIMTASKKPANPTMTLAISSKAAAGREGGSAGIAESIAHQLSRVTVSEFVHRVQVQDCIVGRGNAYEREYKIAMALEPTEMLPASLRKSTAAREALPAFLQGRFALQVLTMLEKVMNKAEKGNVDVAQGRMERAKRGGDAEEDDEDDAGDVRVRGEGEEEEEEDGADEEEDAEAGEEGGAKGEAKQAQSKGYTEADRADRKALKASKKKKKARDSDDDSSEADSMEEEEEEQEEAGVSVTIEPFSIRDKTRLKALCMKYDADVALDMKTLLFTMSIHVSASRRRVMLVQLVEEVAAKCVVQELHGVNKCFVLEPSKKPGSDPEHTVMTEGATLDLLTLWRFNRQKGVEGALDLSRVGCNDVAQIRRIYGVEAARGALLGEISGIFKAYGIGVDMRHLSLIADYMTYTGDQRPMNRIGINHSSSPLLKMSFETTCKFLTDASLCSDNDLLTSPSARLILGRPVASGTGYFDVRLALRAQ